MMQLKAIISFCRLLSLDSLWTKAESGLKGDGTLTGETHDDPDRAPDQGERGPHHAVDPGQQEQEAEENALSGGDGLDGLLKKVDRLVDLVQGFSEWRG